MKKCRWGWIGVVVLAAGVSAGRAQVDHDGAAGEEDATVITSLRLTFDYGSNYAVFEEDVVVTDPKMRLTSDRLAVWFNEEGSVSLIKAEGRVHIIQEDKTASSEEATYEVATGKIVLEKNPRLQRGLHYLEGTMITYYRDKEILIVEPQSRLVIYPEGGQDPFEIIEE